MRTKWHKVEEGCPPVGALVLCYDLFYGRIAVGHNTGRLDDHGFPRLVFEDSDDCEITHWTAMPDPPQD